MATLPKYVFSREDNNGQFGYFLEVIPMLFRYRLPP